MGTRPLLNSSWGFDSNCFVCEAGNEAGLRIPFEHDDVAEVVRARFRLDDRFSGAPSYVHGGLTMALLDEAMAWAVIAIGGRFGVTSETTVRFVHPVRVGRHYRVEAKLEDRGEDRIAAAAVVVDDRDRPCAEARATFTVLSAAQATDAVGTELTGPDAAYVRPEG